MTSAFASKPGEGLTTRPDLIDPAAFAELCIRTGDALRIARLAHARAVEEVDLLRQPFESDSKAIEVSHTLVERLDVLLGALLARLGVQDQRAGMCDLPE